VRSKLERPDAATAASGPGPAAANPIWLHAPAAPAGSLPAAIPGMTAVGDWPGVLERVRAEQGDRPLRVVVYPCAPLQVLG
jgi:hypothetical protein